jgi:phospholipase C
VPFVLASAWANPNHVSHQVADHTSILRLIERRFNLPALSNRDANAHDLMDMFDFSSMQFEQPPSLATQPTSGVCRFSEVAA